MEYKFSQSGLKDLEDPQGCPFRWRAVHIDKIDTTQLGLAASYGNFFEHLCLGTNTGVRDLQKLKSGAQSALEKRIREQASLFKKMHNTSSDEYIGEEVIACNIPLKAETGKGILDYFTSDIHNEITWWDLKFVLDLEYGYYKYGDHDNADYTQQIMYKHLLIENGFKSPKMGLMIFEGGPKMRVKVIRLKISEDVIDLTKSRINAASFVIEMYEKKGWVKTPSELECKKCS